MFYDKNNLFIGLLLGFALPFVGYAIFLMTLRDLLHFRPQTCAIIALCINALVLQWFKKRRYDESMRGVVIATSVYALAWFYLFGTEIIENLGKVAE
ncbi:MAG: hypothetical protein RLZZ292_3485 [Bacteroidota bacterium]|jgi:hypothetical protein